MKIGLAAPQVMHSASNKSAILFSSRSASKLDVSLDGDGGGGGGGDTYV